MTTENDAWVAEQTDLDWHLYSLEMRDIAEPIFRDGFKAGTASAQERLEEAEHLLVMAREALRITREYVGEKRLPNIEGWAHYDAAIAIDAFLDSEPASEEVSEG